MKRLFKILILVSIVFLFVACESIFKNFKSRYDMYLTGLKLDGIAYHNLSYPVVYVNSDGVLNILAGFGGVTPRYYFSNGKSRAAFQVRFKIKVSDFKDGECYEFDNSVARVTNVKKDSMLEIKATCDQVDDKSELWLDYDTEIISGWVSFNGVDFNSGNRTDFGHSMIEIDTINFEVSFRDKSGRVFHMKDGYFHGESMHYQY